MPQDQDRGFGAKILNDLATEAGSEANGRKEIDRLNRQYGCFIKADANQIVQNRMLLRGLHQWMAGLLAMLQDESYSQIDEG
ncbi:uncharacterized protein ColSpa_08975 [Colletotrichum spaethianum]|uniref:Uncharacterized protein n=1 Tax=Colletotrichum spaethianum TaxID=700344 RepID=A0AA37UIY2_9PEZI|nr:uncharacterized protein ColSpa_08975 [Colletotrichum spaethianum]GKT48794.1 hypothetical protein ColSpa_08975 [Colletotrichum spaethianum]